MKWKFMAKFRRINEEKDYDLLKSERKKNIKIQKGYHNLEVRRNENSQENVEE